MAFPTPGALPPAQAPAGQSSDNGVGGAPGTHDNHADVVPSVPPAAPVGTGFVSIDDQTSGNKAAQCY